MTFEMDLEDFKNDLLNELDALVEQDVSQEILQLLYDLSPYSPSFGVKKGSEAGRLSPYSLDKYRNSHKVTKHKDGSYTIENTASNKNYNYADKVEMGWKRKDGTITHGYWVYYQALNILSKETDYIVSSI